MNSKTILTTFNVRALGSNYSAVSIVGTGIARPYGEDINTVTTNLSHDKRYLSSSKILSDIDAGSHRHHYQQG